MINFASLFNQFRMGGGSSSLNDLIETPGTTLARLLDEDSFFNEFKSGNSKVAEFMKYDKYQTLTDYVTKIGPEDDRKRSYKYPLVACDVLSCDSQAVIEYFFPENQLYVTEEVLQDKEPEEEAKPEQVEAKVTSVERIEEPDTKEDKGEETEAPKPEQENTDFPETTSATETPSKVEEKREPKFVKKEVPPLSKALFSYYEGEVNYTLAGYVSKVFSAFLTKKPTIVLKFLLNDFDSVLKHVESRSVSDLIVRIITYESTECLEERRVAFESLLEKASKPEETYVMSNLSAAICEIIEKVSTALKGNGNEYANELSALYFKPEIITKVITNVMSDEENVSVYNAPILSSYLINVPLVLPDNTVEDHRELLKSFLKKALDKLQITREERRTLGFGRVKIVEIMSFVLKQNIFRCQDLAAEESEFYPTLFRLCQNYQLNNVLHNEVVKIIQIALSQEETSPFQQSLLKEGVLMTFLTEQVKEDLKIKAGEGSQRVRKGYIGHIVQICRKLQEYSAANNEIKKFVDSDEFNFILENFVNKEVFESSKNLAGYGMNKKSKNTILFMKEEVIQEHIKFLTETPAPIYEAEPEHTNIEHPDLVQAEHMSIENTPTIDDLIAECAIPESVSVDSESDNPMDPKFWNRHLQYNIDDLMNDL